MHDDHFRPIRTFSSSSVPELPPMSRTNSNSTVIRSKKQDGPTSRTTTPAVSRATSSVAVPKARPSLHPRSPSLKFPLLSPPGATETTPLLARSTSSPAPQPQFSPPKMGWGGRGRRPSGANRRVATCTSPPIRQVPSPVIERETVRFDVDMRNGRVISPPERVRVPERGGRKRGCCCGVGGKLGGGFWMGVDWVGEGVARWFWPLVEREEPGKKGREGEIEEVRALFED